MNIIVSWYVVLTGMCHKTIFIVHSWQKNEKMKITWNDAKMLNAKRFKRSHTIIHCCCCCYWDGNNSVEIKLIKLDVEYFETDHVTWYCNVVNIIANLWHMPIEY